ncbi:hypothetical protein [Streptococcus vestibularis]|jgi:hypothetical protein|uniref:hypothetical protein n=1 Tax=Streptococcus vestibularis TaxID=1343 RepID=UPI000E44D99D|nr:hypothetical protein [Streptococcus vestibularis]MDU5563553.1 hypothetical protein [Streptococcus vestibularis]RGM52448.1 hypothetical protein DXC09_05720 [Streptococcus vestibularis]
MKKKNCLFTFSVILLSIALTGCSASKNLINTAKNISGGVTSKSSSSSTTSSSSTISSSSSSVSSSNFNPQDTSDATIRSISTYNDYITMYSKIVDEYLTNYQNAVAGTVLDDANTIEQMKQETLKSLEEQKKEYGAMGNTKIIGKDSLVEFLKNYRNGLKEYTDNISTQIQ